MKGYESQLKGLRKSLEFRHLEALRAVERHRSFSAAAESLGYTQSAISQQLARLEQAVGQPLIERPRGPKRVSLTPAGTLLCEHAEAIAARLASAAADLHAMSDGTAGTLRVGCYQSVGVRILPRVLRRFHEAWPDVRIELTEAEDDAELLQGVENGELDLTFMVYPMTRGPFASVELLEDPYVVVDREDSGLANEAGPITWRHLMGRRVVTYAKMRDEHAIENRLGRPELASQIVFRSNDNGTIQGLASEGVGVAVVSWLSVDTARNGLRVFALAGVNPRMVGLAWHSERHRNPAAEAFVRVAREEAFYENERMEEALVKP